MQEAGTSVAFTAQWVFPWVSLLASLVLLPLEIIHLNFNNLYQAIAVFSFVWFGIFGK